MANSFKALSLLLSYPTADLQSAARAIGAVLDRDPRLPAETRAGLAAFVEDFATRDLYDLQERYVLLFDRTRSLSLHLYEHVHGESRDRGQALVNLLALYERHGLAATARELPDFLPLYLEFLSLLPEAEARARAGDPRHIVIALRERLEKRASPYAALLAAVEALAEGATDTQSLAELRAAPDDDPDDLAALDRAWAEEPVTFGPGREGAGGCPRAEDIVRQMQAGPGGKAVT